MLDNFSVGSVVTLKGINKRGKDRIHEHGDTFRVKSFSVPSREGCILFESMNKTFRLGAITTHWSGWLEVPGEVEVCDVLGDI